MPVKRAPARRMRRMMGRPFIDGIQITGPRGTVRAATALFDTGSNVTIIGRDEAAAAGVECTGPGERSVEIAGKRVPVCERRITIAITESECHATMDVLVARKAIPGRYGNIMGADFMERSGMVLDLRRGDHFVHCDRNRRDNFPPAEKRVTARKR